MSYRVTAVTAAGAASFFFGENSFRFMGKYPAEPGDARSATELGGSGPIIRARDRTACRAGPAPAVGARQPAVPERAACHRRRADPRDLSLAGAGPADLLRRVSRRLPGELYAGGRPPGLRPGPL